MSRAPDGRVELSHGGGGRAMARLIEEIFLPAFGGGGGDDAARLGAIEGELVMATDSHVVTPLFFPGGDIGALAVHGTVNDVAMSGARPRWLSAGFILEEGFPLADLARIARSMGAAAREAGVAVVTGDTKVVARGQADGVFINTTGVGVVPPGITIAGDRARAGDAIVLSGSLGDHGMAILSQREDIGFGTDLASDTAALHDLVATMLAVEPGLRCLRDPTRGGLAAALNELARQSAVGMHLDEAAIPVREEVHAACEFLGLDPLHLANEGKLVAIVPAASAERVVAAMRDHPRGREAAVIGEVVEDPHHLVEMRTPFGGNRLVDWLHGEPLPRIC